MKALTSLWLIFCCLICTSCQKEKTSPKKLRLVLDRPVNPSHLPLYVGYALGYFYDEGIVLEIQKHSTDHPLDLLLENRADLVCASLPRVLRQISKKGGVACVGKIFNRPLKGFVILTASGIKTIDDFNGRMMGVNGANCTLSSSEALLAERNILIGVKRNAGDNAVPELMQGTIDILYGALYNLEPEYLNSQGHKTRFFFTTDFGVPDYEELVVAATSALQANTKLVTSFQKALQKSIDVCKKNPERAFTLYKNLFYHKSGSDIQWEEVAWNKTLPYLVATQKFSYKRVKLLADWLYEHGLISRPLDFAPHFASLVQAKQDSAK